MASQGPLSPGTVVSTFSYAGYIPWTNPDNAKVSDNIYTTSARPSGGVGSEYLDCSSFGFDIPLNSKINGLLIEVEGKVNTGTTTCRVFQRFNGTSGFYSATLTTTEQYLSFGGLTDLWGQTGWTPEMINTGYVRIYVFEANNTVSIDHVRVTVAYTLSAPLPIFRPDTPNG